VKKPQYEPLFAKRSYEEFGRYDDELEIDTLRYRIQGFLPKDVDKTALREKINLFETDVELLNRQQERIRLVQRNPKLALAFAKLSHQPYGVSEHPTMSTLQLTYNAFRRDVELLTTALSTAENDPFFQQVNQITQKAQRYIDSVDEACTTNYELQATLHTRMRVIDDGRTYVDCVGPAKLELLVHETHSGLLTTEKRRVNPNAKKGIHVECGANTVYARSLFYDLEEYVQGVLKKKGTIKPTDTIEATVDITVEQSAATYYRTAIKHTITHNGRTYEGRQAGAAGQGFRLANALREQELTLSATHLEAAQEIAAQYSEMMVDLQATGVLALASNALEKRGARWPTIQEEGGIYMRKAKNPLLTVTNKRVVANDIPFRDHWFGIANGTNFNGKTTLLITTAQNTVMAQTPLPIFARDAYISPRDRIITQFPEYGGRLGEQSAWTAQVKHMRDTLVKQTPRTLNLLDEPGLGANPEEAMQFLRELLIDGSAELPALRALRGPITLMTTNYLSFAQEVQARPGVLAIAFHSDKPYVATYGCVANKSDAIRVAQQHGFSADDKKQILKQWEKANLVTDSSNK
jgi:hypothetical protein